MQREHECWQEYLTHARVLDVRLSAAGTTPIEDRLKSFTRTRCLAFGQYGEASPDVHALLVIAAEAMAKRRWRLLGARTQQEAYGFFISSLRRRMGVVTVRAMHRLGRLPFVGVPRAAVEARLRRGAPGLGGGAPVEHRHQAPDFYAYQGHLVHAQVAA